MPVFACALMLAFLTLAPALAQTALPASASWETSAAPDIRPVQIPLTPERIERFLASLPQILAFARELDPPGTHASRLLDDDIAFLLMPHLLDPAFETRANALVAGFGFSSYEDWANTGHSVSLVLETADITGSLDLESQKQAALRDIERNAGLSADEKARALDELKNQFAALAEFQPLPGNREVAAPYIKSLRAAIDR